MIVRYKDYIGNENSDSIFDLVSAKVDSNHYGCGQIEELVDNVRNITDIIARMIEVMIKEFKLTPAQLTTIFDSYKINQILEIKED